MKLWKQGEISLLLAAVLLLGTAWTLPQTAAAEEPQPDTAQIVAFDNDDTIRSFGAAVNTAVRKSFARSGKWDHSSGGKRKQTNEYKLADHGAPTDWSAYGYYNIWMYSEKANGASINVLLYDSSGKYNRYALRVDWENEWKCISIPLGGPMLNQNISGFADIQKIRFNAGDWGVAVDATTCLYFDQIFLSKELPEQRSIVAADLNLANDRGGFGFAEERETVYSAASGKWDHAGGGKKRSKEYVLANQGVETDWTQQAYLNIRVYSAVANGATVNVVANGQTGYFLGKLQVDWAGSWNVVRMPLGSFSVNGGITSWGDMKSLQFNAGDWGTTVDPTTCLYFDKIWLSPSSAAAQDETVLAMDSEAAVRGFGLVPEMDITKSYGVSGKWDHSGGGKQRTQEYALAANGKPDDWAAQGFLHLTVYSAVSNDSKVNVLLHDKRGGYYLSNFTVDWEEGWRTITLPLGAFSANGNVSRLADLKSIQFNVGDWGTTVDPTTCLYVDQMWASPQRGVAVPDEQELIAFHNASAARKLGLEATADVTYQGAAMSALWELSELSETDALEIRRSGAATDWTSYAYVNLWLFSRVADGTDVTVTMEDESGGTCAAAFPLDWDEGWKTVSLPLAEFEPESALDSVQRLILRASGQTEHTSLYLDRITVSKQLPTDAAEEDALIASFGTARDVRLWNFAQDTDTVRYRPMTGRWEHASLARSAVFSLQRAGGQTDWSGYSYVNLWVYSQKPTTGSFSLVAQSTDGYFRARILADWTGWRQISIPKKQFTAYGSADWAQVQSVYLDAGGWDTTLDEETVLNLDKIWISHAAPAGSVLPSADSVVAAQFDNEAAVNKPGKLTVDRDVTHLYEMSAKWSDMPSKQYFDWNVNGLDAGGCAYYYQWLYSGAANGADINLVLYSGADDNNYFRSVIHVDWTGWKLLEIPLGKFDTKGSPSWSNIRTIRFHANAWGTTAKPDTVLNLEKIWFTKDKLPALRYVSMEPADGYDGVPAGGPLRLTFSAELAQTVPDGAVMVRQAGANPVTCRAASVGKTLVVEFDQRLTPDTDYEIRIEEGALMDAQGQLLSGGVQAAFKTAPAGLEYADITFVDALDAPLYTLPEGGLILAETSVRNFGAQPAKAALVLALYDETGRMVHLGEGMPETVNPAGANTLTVRVDLPSYDGLHAAAFVLTGGVLAGGSPAYLGRSPKRGADVSASAQNRVTLESCKVELDTVTFSGKLESPFGRTLLLRVTDERGAAALLVPLQCGAGASYAYTYKLDNKQDGGAYQVTVTGNQVAGSAQGSFRYLNETQQTALLAAINGAGGNLQKLVKDNYFVFGLDEQEVQDGNLAAHIAAVLGEHRPIASYTQMTQLAKDARDLLDQLNVCDFLTLSSFLSANAAFVLHGSAEYGTYRNLGKDAQKSINKTILKNGAFSGFGPFRTAFAAAVQAYLSSGAGGSGGGTGGGGPGGGRDQGTQYQMGSGGPLPTPEATPGPDPIYSDLADAAWARESILALTQRGIVSGGGDGTYRPLDGVTREEFVKLLVEAFGLADSAAQCTFTDAQPDAWYAPYLASAERAGIVQGDGGGRFGVGEGITRQDAAVMAQRALIAAGLTLPDSEPATPFADDGSIAGYAKTAVYAMRGAGVLGGVGENSFAPQDGTNRAQAAKIVYELLQTARQNGKENA